MHQLWGIENFEEQKSTSTQACIVFVLYWHSSLKKKKKEKDPSAYLINAFSN